VAHGDARPVDLVLAGEAAHLQRRLGETQQARGADGVRRHDAARRIDRQIAAERGDAVGGHAPAVVELGEPEALQPHRLEPGERHVELGDVDLPARIGNACLTI
jgi:hypothetical protein